MSYFEGNEFFFFLILALVIGFIINYLGKRSEYYILTLSVIFAIVIYGKKTLMLSYLIGFIIYQYILVLIAHKTQNAKYLKILVFLSVVPLIINKVFALTQWHLLAFIGISYMSFKTIQIMIEISDGLIKERVSIIDYIQFLLFFPTVSSGPIDRSRRFMVDIKERMPRDEYLELAGVGVYRVVLGLLYKVVLSTYSYHYLVTLPNFGSLEYSIKYMYLYTLYLFFDFAGYSLMAVGSSNILGIKTPMNFNKPFLSIDIKDFWNRWHISLSHWFRDFIFSRLVFAMFKRKTFKSSLTTAMVAYVINMSVMGIWHGLNLSYFLYGLYHGIILALTELFQKTKFYKANKNKKWFEYSSIFVTFNLVMFGFFIFSEKFVHILRILGGRLW